MHLYENSKMKKILVIIITLFTLNINAQLQDGGYKDFFKEGSLLILEENFDQALKNFLRAYDLDSSSANINYLVGTCYLKSHIHKTKAEYYLSKAVKDIDKNYKMDDPTEKSAPPLAYFYYGQSLNLNYKFDDAITWYEKFRAQVPNDKRWKKEIDYHHAHAEYAKDLVAVPMNITLTNMGDSINSEYPEYSPCLSADERTMIYTTRRPQNVGGEKTPDGQYFEDIVVSYKDDEGRWSKPVSVGEYVNTNGHEASINLSADGQTLIVYRDDGGNGNLYYSQWDGKTWSSLQEFGSDVNTKYWESHACLSADGNTLYFISDRPGGKGGRDIYRCVKLPNGKWSKALNIGEPLNTEYDEEGVFIHPDGKTFFFASKGHRSMGGFDLMFSIIDEDGKFSDPFNLGHPINTPDDDVFYVTSPDGKRSYFSSFHDDGSLGDKDIYRLSVPKAGENPLVLFKGQIVAAEGEALPEDIVIIVTEKATGEIVGQYRPKQNGTFTTILPPGKEYNFSYTSLGKEFYNEDVFVSNDLTYQEIKKEINLEPIKMVGKVKIVDRGILLNVVVINSHKDMKSVKGAKVTIKDKLGKFPSDTAIVTDKNGVAESIKLVAENTYSVIVNHDGKKVNAVITTAGIKESKLITQLIYLDGKVVSANPNKYKLLLNVTVLHPKTKKPIADADVVMTGNDGSKFEAKTDKKGRLEPVQVEPGVNYDLLASKDEVASDKVYFTTANTVNNKTYNKTLFLNLTAKSVIAVVTKTTTETVGTKTTTSVVKVKLSPGKFEHYFTYNKNQIEDDNDWGTFIDNVVALTQSKKKSVSVTINSSASKVPTMISFKNNKELSGTRAALSKEKIIAAVEAKGGDVKKLKFTLTSVVGGPPWREDHIERKAEFEKHQYVKIYAK